LANEATKNAANNQFKKQRQAENGKRAMLDYENAAIASRVKTARLRAQRLAHEAALAEAEAAAPAEKKKAKKKK
jgi:hypothetical protein